MTSIVPPAAAGLAGMNRVVLSASLVERKALRYTPAGLPALDLLIQHESVVSEDSQPRKVSMELRAVGLGHVTSAVSDLTLGAQAQWVGFLASGRNGRGVVFHVTQVTPLSALEPLV